jgi:trehalose 6-phosphate synthase
VQDYHLQLVPQLLRELRPDVLIGFFMHVPFPPPELFMQLPRRVELLRGMLGADLVGFQREQAAHNLAQLAGKLLGRRVRRDTIRVDGRVVRTGAFPVSIDVAEMESLAARPYVRNQARKLRHDLGSHKKVLLSVDRLDYTKGIEHRLTAYSELLRDGRLKVRDAVMVQVAVPSRERVESYRGLKDRIEGEVGRINGEYGRVGEPAIHYLNQPFDRADLAALYQTADVMVVTPLRDGMNLVAKEFVAARATTPGRWCSASSPGRPPSSRTRSWSTRTTWTGSRRRCCGRWTPTRPTWPGGCRRCASTSPITTSTPGPGRI